MRSWNRNLFIIKLVFLVIFAASCAGVWWHQLAVVRPRQACQATPGGVWDAGHRTCHIPPEYACEHHGGWWDPVSKTCARVISVPSVTGRPVS